MTKPHAGVFDHLRWPVCAVFVVLLLLCWWSPASGQSEGSGKNEQMIATLRMQVEDLDRQISTAQNELSAVGSFNVACCIGWNFLFPIGTLIWYLTDIKPRDDRKKELTDKINRLQSEKQSLQNQIITLQVGK